MTEILQGRSVAAASLVAAALFACLLAGSSSNNPTALSVRGKEMSRTRQLEQESARESALARLEAKVPRFAPPLFSDLACHIVDNL
jgi:hypothetical protein